MKHLPAILLMCSAMAMLATAQPAAPRYVIFMIGDGMGWPHVQLADYYRGAQAGTRRAPLHMGALPVVGVMQTHSANQLITDSAAAGTALACGVKTSNGCVGMDTNGVSFHSIAAVAKRHGRKVGIVTTDTLVGATPAVYYAHHPYRRNCYPIGVDLFRSGFDLYVAAGDFDDPNGTAITTNILATLTNELAAFVVAGNPAKNATGITWRNLHSLTAEYHYTWITSPETWHAAHPSNGNLVAVLDIPHLIDSTTGALTLADVTRKSLALLDNPTGFFIMVEGARIDKRAHQNDAAAVLFETLDFDNAVAVALDFYTNHPNDTLIVVTADHETGGMTVGQGGNDFLLLGRQGGRAELFRAAVDQYRASHSPRSLVRRWWETLVGGDDAGKATARFADILPLLHDYFRFGHAAHDIQLSPDEWRQLELAFNDSMADHEIAMGDEVFQAMYGSEDPLTLTACHLLNARAGVRWTTLQHSGADVPVFSIGVGSETLAGRHDNTGLPRTIMQLMLPGQPFPEPMK